MKSNLVSLMLLALSTSLFANPLSPESTSTLHTPPQYVGTYADPVWDFTPDELTTFTVMLKASGARSLRMPLRWSVIEPVKGQRDYSALERDIAAVPPNVEILGTLMSVPLWANGIDPKKAEGWADTYPPKDLADWEKYVHDTVAHFKGRINHWEIWNEQNGVDFYRPLPDPAGYTSLLKSAYQGAKRADPDCIVVLGGLQMNGIIANPWSPVKTPNFLDALYKAGARPYFDVCNIHPYVLPQEGADYMMSLIHDTLAVMDRHGDTTKTVWLTEVGCGATSPEKETDQARLLTDTYRLTVTEPRIQRVYWFLLRDTEKDLLGPEASMGLYTFTGRSKPALKAFQEAARALSRP